MPPGEIPTTDTPNSSPSRSSITMPRGKSSRTVCTSRQTEGSRWGCDSPEEARVVAWERAREVHVRRRLWSALILVGSAFLLALRLMMKDALHVTLHKHIMIIALPSESWRRRVGRPWGAPDMVTQKLQFFKYVLFLCSDSRRGLMRSSTSLDLFPPHTPSECFTRIQCLTSSCHGVFFIAFHRTTGRAKGGYTSRKLL